ncbi:protein CREBRF homolog [Galendromus occidentalis]|uniref:Protein CREBRF homolog n=1 Tax=Galendromus occidentalis TaxID=34638 RepID=A0AAJ7SDD0_9ACAR|nr:protein CREBRF homolog [Galendromus occidentalis]
MVHPGQTSSNTSSSGQQTPASPTSIAMPPQRSQNIQIANSGYGTPDSCPLPGTSVDQSSAGSSNNPVPHSSWVSPPDNSTLNFENRLITEDSLYPSLVSDLNTAELSGDILEYLPTLEDSKRSSDPSDSQGLMWELEPDDDRITDKLTEDKLWSQQPMDFELHSVFKNDIKSEFPGEPTLAELNANEDSSNLLDTIDVNSFLMESFDNKTSFSQQVNLLSPLADIKVEPNTTVGAPAAAVATAGATASSWSGSSFVDPLQAQSSSQSSGLQTLSPPSSCQVASVGPTFLNPLPPDVYSTLSSSLPSTSSGLPGKQHQGGGKATSRSFLHSASPLHSPARKNPLASGKPKGPIPADRLSTSAPSANGMDQMWKARKAEVLRNGRLRHGSTDTTLSQLSSVQLTMDEGFSSQEADEEDDSDNEDRSSGEESGSDNEYEGGARSPLSPSSLASDEPGSGKKKGKYFWQYNVQAKGPKGPRMKVTKVAEDPHVLSDVTDPVFSPDCQLEGVKHAGKARRGDGNDLTPNPNKLYNIGIELDKLNRIINELTPPTDLPSNARNKSRKEKNKLASRACRLKKKAQHEANKLKLFGLQVEHKRLLDATAKMRQLCIEKAQGSLNSDEHKRRLDQLVSEIDTVRVAGLTAEYVNKILSNVNAGVPRGGIDA